MFTQDRPKLAPEKPNLGPRDLPGSLGGLLRAGGNDKAQEEDPLAHFYALAKAEQDSDVSAWAYHVSHHVPNLCFYSSQMIVWASTPMAPINLMKTTAEFRLRESVTSLSLCQ